MIFIIINILSINNYKSLLCKVLIERKKIKAQNIQAIFGQLLNFSILDHKRSSICKIYFSPFKLYISLLFCWSACIIQQHKSWSIRKSANKTLYTPQKIKEVKESYVYPIKRLILTSEKVSIITVEFYIKKSQIFFPPSDIYLILLRDLKNNFVAKWVIVLLKEIPAQTQQM